MNADQERIYFAFGKDMRAPAGAAAGSDGYRIKWLEAAPKNQLPSTWLSVGEPGSVTCVSP